MSNILIIKLGSLGDIAQISGAIQDISENHKADQLFLLTTKPYLELFKKNPYIKDVILDKRLSRLNLIYLYLLMKNLKLLNIQKVYDLQNSSRTKFYKNILFPKANSNIWSSSETTLPFKEIKSEFDKEPVLNRFDHQLKSSNIKTIHTMKPNFNWACTDISHIKKYYDLKKYIILFPFCSTHLTHKKWPHYNELIDSINNNLQKDIKIIIAPGPNEIDSAKNINATCILNKDKSLNISELASLIKDSSFVIANDTGPAHMAAHLNAKGVALFGKHTTGYKVSIERENFKVIQVDDLEKLTVNNVFEKLKKNFK
tara:strand:+ start:35 stop:976 length:942 start_codon:yes stop_codon:yes gene_type:complete